MAVIRANRESIDDRFSVLGFTVRSELPLYEIGIATDPELLRAEHRARRTPHNFFTTRLLRVLPTQQGEAVYLVPPEVVSRFVGQQRLYFGLATYRESDRSTPISLRMPDRGTMYVSISGLTERGLRRTVRSSAINAYGNTGYGDNASELAWGGDVAGKTPPPSRDEDRAPREDNSASASLGSNTTSGYSDGYSDDLWHQTPAAARSLLISSDYNPSNLFEALRAQLGFFLDSAMWYLGVANTGVMPHSAICQIRRPDGTAEGALHGSGFFIGPRLILTAAHVVDGQSELIVVPGKNGGGTGSTTEPYGRIKVTNFRKHGSYSTSSNSSDYDMALIQVPAANAVSSGRYFDLVEELNQSRPEGVVVTGYAARWYANDLIEHFVNDNIDPDRQHMMGGYIRELPTDETFSYNIQTLGGTSGSPVYWIEDTGTGPQAHLVGVHVAAHDSTTNLGCRITAGKLSWIQSVAAEWGQTLTFSTGPRARSLSAVDDDSGYDIGGPIPDDATGIAGTGQDSRGLTLTAPEYPLADRFEAADVSNYRAVSTTRTIDRIVIHITDGGASLNGPISWFRNPAANVSAHYVIGQDGTIVQMVAHKDVAWHAGSANGTSIGIEHVANTRGLTPTAQQMCASAALVTWLCDQYAIPIDRTHILGHAEADSRTTHQACPNAVWDWNYFMDMITTRTCYEPASILPTGSIVAQSVAQLQLPTQPLGSNGYVINSDHTAATDADDMAIEGDIPDDGSASQTQSHLTQARSTQALEVPAAPEYPQAQQFAPAHPNNYTVGRNGTAIDLIVIHINGTRNDYDRTVRWFQNPHQVMARSGRRVRVSAHYVVGRGGEVVQMVRHADTAHHAHGANRRSIGIEHNATANGGHVPTDVQYRNSAKLVAWLCVQLGIPADRAHILGHSEADPGTTHTSCPNSVWDWNTYMAYLATEVAALTGGAAAAQTLAGERTVYSATQEILTPFYDPTDTASALTSQANAFSPAREAWFAGVPNTSLFPHSAICLLEMQDTVGHVARGTGFYIGRNRILTCAHNLYDQASVTIIPGKNGDGGTDTEPFGRATVPSASWRIPASYAGTNQGSDLAVIENVPIDAPDGQWFDHLEELTQSRTEGVVVCGYSSRSERVPELTQAIDGFRQHLHAGYIAEMADDESTFSYPILTLKRASGSPVYYISDKSGSLQSYVVGVHIASDTDDLNRGCRLVRDKIDWIESRTTSLSLDGQSRALDNESPSDIPVQLIAQPDKNACWAAAMAMLLGYRGTLSLTPESIVNDVGGTLAASYNWDLLQAVRERYGFAVIDQPSNTSLYHTPRQWAEWLNTHGPLWVVIVGAPHAVVVAGIRGDLSDPAQTQVKVLNPWDTRVAFDNDPVEFHPANHGYEDWLSFAVFASDFGTMAASDYGNWRILHLPVSATKALSMSERMLKLASPPPPVRAFGEDRTGERREPIEPSRISGTAMQRVIGAAGSNRWSLDQLRGMKSPATATATAGVDNGTPTDVRIIIDDWPAIEGAPTPLPLTIDFRTNQGAIGDVSINAGTPASLDYGVEVVARIEDCADADGVARIRIRIDYRFRGLSQGSPDANIELCLRGDGRHERDNAWRDANVLSPAA